ncbi:MAG TPA: EamA family transporter [Methanothermococcus okinawensis]|uniref:Bacterial/archaeal transporter family protein n=1 Tax=Methanofervidicoccus abyssi TaxID=2082189 RepID=A0A401HNQ7_9EURY|nr:EamA family transporter [Methanofervidicoccus abyssi]GBF35842.1 bacterial/archaeal transporter family protein [Methanofervidicoccus abyssi]HIP16314.1 EamA family transporter [Methanothermococcus okinawensis]
MLKLLISDNFRVISINNDVIVGILIAILYGVGTFFAKIVSEKDPFIQWIIVNIVGMILSIFIIIKDPQRLWQIQGKILIYGVISAVMVVLGSLLLYYMLNKGKASIVVPLSSIGPAITTILAVIFLREYLSTNQIIGIILVILGIVLLSMNS